MFYIENKEKPHVKFPLGTLEFERVICKYILNTDELTATQFQTFMGTLLVLDLHDELMSRTSSSYVVRFSPDE